MEIKESFVKIKGFFANRLVKKSAIGILIIIILVASAATIYTFIVYTIGNTNQELYDSVVTGISSSVVRSLSEQNSKEAPSRPSLNSCKENSGNVAKLILDGDIVSGSGYSDSDGYPMVSSADIVFYLNKIQSNDNFKAVLLSIDSAGGEPVGSEEVTKSVKNFNKPIIAVLRGTAASGAYMVASGADRIFASKMSHVGSIGVTSSYTDNSIKNAREGLTYNSLSSGKFKDARNSDKPLTYEERQIIMRDILKSHDIFVQMVAENRNLPIEKVKKIADGSTMLGDDALANGLIDEIGGEPEAMQWLSGPLGQKVTVCDYN